MAFDAEDRDAPDSLVRDLFCMPLRLISVMCDDESAPHDDVASFFGIGPAAECPNVAGAIRRGVVAFAAYRAVRAHRRDAGVPSVAVADRLARAAAALAHAAARPFWLNRERRMAPRDPRPLARPLSPRGAADGCGHAVRETCRGRGRATRRQLGGWMLEVYIGSRSQGRGPVPHPGTSRQNADGARVCGPWPRG